MSNTFELCDHHVVVIWMHGRNKNANIWIYWHTAGCFSGLCSSVWGTEECKPVAFSISQCWWTNWQCGAWWFFYDAKTLTISYYRSAQYSIVTEVWFLLPSQGNWIRSPGLGYCLRSDFTPFPRRFHQFMFIKTRDGWLATWIRCETSYKTIRPGDLIEFPWNAFWPGLMRICTDLLLCLFVGGAFQLPFPKFTLWAFKWLLSIW